MVRRDVVDPRVAAHRQPVLHDREAVGDQLGVPHDLLGVGALVVLVGVDHLAIRGQPARSSGSRSRAACTCRSAGRSCPVCVSKPGGRRKKHIWWRVGAIGTVMPRGASRPGAQRPAQTTTVGAWISPPCRADAGHTAAGHEEGLDRDVLHDGGAELAGARGERVRGRRGVGVAGLGLVRRHREVIRVDRGHERLELRRGSAGRPSRPGARARRTFSRRFAARSSAASQRMPTWRKPGSPPPTSSAQRWNRCAEALPVRVRKSIA